MDKQTRYGLGAFLICIAVLFGGIAYSDSMSIYPATGPGAATVVGGVKTSSAGVSISLPINSCIALSGEAVGTPCDSTAQNILYDGTNVCSRVLTVPRWCANQSTGLFNAGFRLQTGGVGGIFTGANVGVATAGYYYQGAIANSAGNSANDFANSVALSSGVDRFAARYYSDNGSTLAARITSDGTLLEQSTIGTAASGTGITAVYSGAVRQFVHKVTVINTALAAAAISDITLAVTPSNTHITRVTANVTQVFTGGALSAMTVQCGNSAGGTQYLLAGSVLTATTTLGDVVAEIGAGLVDSTRADMGTVASGVPGAITTQCRFTCTGANCSAATQGSVTFYVEGTVYN